MRNCPKCSKPVEDGASICSACGQEMPATPSGTLDADQLFDVGTSASVDSSATEAPRSDSHSEDQVDGTLETPEITEPSVDAASDAGNAAEDVGKTVDISAVGSDDDAGFTLSTDEDQSVDGTFVMPERDGDPVDNNNIAGKDVSSTVDISAGNADSDMDFSLSSDSTSASGTMQYSDDDLQDASEGTGKSGTDGRLKHLWMGAAGSSANPMHTLKGAESQATDSVFDRVASRVLVTDTAIAISEMSGAASKSQPDRKARVEECIADACRGGDSATADYDLTGFLGQGGMGVVLKARQRAIGRDVALKMVQPAKGDSKASTIAQQKKFFYEAQITGKLDHPNIVPIYELGISNDILFYSMKMIIGTEWKDVIKSSSREENLDTLEKVADAMAFAHEKGVIHRDLKPENVMLGPFGEVLVTDWGCAVDLSRNEKFTGAGSPPWMAPEMAAHDLDLIGPRSDIYLLGAMLYQVIAGYPPHPGQTVFECIRAAAKNTILPLEIEDPLLDIAYRAMETEPSERYASVEDMQAAIREYRQHAESITLTDRSDNLLQQAIESKDYERFSRTVFGYQDAIELWPQNTAAVDGLQRARLAYGKCAFDKADYDLCLQTLDVSVPAESELYAAAEKAKKVSDEREGRFKLLRRVLAAVVIFAIVGLSGLSTYAFRKRSEAISSAAEAVENEKTAERNAQTARDNADEAERNAKEAKANEITANENAARAEENRKEAVENLEKANEQEAIATANFIESEKQRKEAERLQGVADVNAKEANRQTEIAQRRTLEVELGAYQSKLALTMSQVKQLAVGNAKAGLAELTDASTFEALSQQGQLPKFKNWALERVQLLSNTDSVSDSLGLSGSAVSFATSANRGVAATSDNIDGTGPGKLHVLHLDGNKLVIERSLPVEAAVDSLAISPDGTQIAFSLARDSGDSTVYTLQLSGEQTVPESVTTLDGMRLQGIAVSSTKIVGGLNGGLYVWERGQKQWTQESSTVIKNVRGRLKSLQLLGPSNALILSELNGTLTAHNADLEEGNGREIAFSTNPNDAFADEKLSAIAFSNGKLVVGTESGRLFSAAYSLASNTTSPTFKQIEPQSHQSSIRAIRVHDDGTLLTVADEPVVHVWDPSRQESGWKHKTHLAGTTANVQDASFMANSSLVIALGESGKPIVWDVSRQQQRQQLRRINPDGSELTYSSPVEHVVTSSDNRRAVSIHTNGTIDSWDLTNGKTLSESEVPFEFVGHSPGAKFVDMAIDRESNILITSALLPRAPDNATNSSTQRGDRMWEFCKWDLSNAEMLDRWKRPSGTEQQISLLDSGKIVLYASDVSTTIAEANNSGEVRFERDQFGSFFAVANPAEKNIVMLVKRSGAVRVFNTNDSASWDVESNQLDFSNPDNQSLLSTDDVPLVGQWSPTGNRFYTIWASGRITEFLWEDSRLSKNRDLRMAELNELGIQLASGASSENATDTIRLTSRRQLDLKVRSHDDFHLLYYSVRFPGPEGRTRLVRVAFPNGEGKPLADKAEQLLGRRHFVLTEDETPELDLDAVANLPISSSDIAASQTRGDTRYFATNSGNVYCYSKQTGTTVLGRPELLSGSGNANADRIVTLHKGGVLWLAEAQANQWQWKQLAGVSTGARSVNLSPDGQRILLSEVNESGQERVLIADANSGEIAEILDGAQCGTWGKDGELAFVQSKTVWLRSPQGDQKIGELHTSGQPQSIHFFSEAWSGEKAPTQWLIVHTEDATANSTDGMLNYFSTEQQAAPETRIAPLGRGISVLACSPTDGIFVTGGYGTVTVHFAAPSLGELDKELFNLEGHAGAQIKYLTFSHDGKTLVSTDERNRQFGWLSEDATGGVVATPIATEAATTVIQ